MFFFKRTAPTPTSLDLTAVRERARRVHSAVGTRDVKLDDLFGFIVEEIKPYQVQEQEERRKREQQKPNEPRRVHPYEV